MPKHVMHYDFKDFERFVREDLARQGYELATGQKPEITDLSQITDFDDVAQLMEQAIMTVQVVPSKQTPEITVPVPLIQPVIPAVASGSSKPAVSKDGSQRGNAIKHGWYSTKVELSPEQKEERAAHFRMKRREAKERKKQTSQATKPVAVEGEVIPVKEVVAPTTEPFPRFRADEHFTTPGGRNFLYSPGDGK